MHHEIMDILPVPVMEFEPCYDDQGAIVDFRFLWANASACKLLLSEGDQPHDQNLFELHPYMRDSRVSRRLVKTVESGERRTFYIRPEEPSRYAGKRLHLMAAPSENGIVVMLNDVTDLITERDTARSQLKMMEAACNDAVSGIAIADPKQRIVYANPALHEALEYSRGELIGMRVQDMVAEVDEESRSVMADQLMNDEINQYITDRTYVTKTGRNVIMSVAVSSSLSDDGEQLSLAHFRDVGDERAAQTALSDALERAEESTRLKSEFLANMSHEIRTPLNGVIGMAQVLSHSELTDQQAEHVSIIQESSSNLLSLLNDILDLSKVEAGKIAISPVEADFRHKLNRLYELYAPAAREKGLDLRVACSPNIPSRLLFDPVRVRQCVGNLVSNAIKFTKSGQVLVAATSTQIGDEYEIKIHVSDTGIGIPPQKLTHIFEAFQQADGSTTRNFGGTGLGLTITRNLAKLMGGDLSVTSEVGRGSIFTLTFTTKTAVPIAQTNDRRPTGIAKPSAANRRMSGQKILVVDDNIVNRQVAKSILEIYGLEIETADDGIDAVEKLQDTPFDLVLMDIHMPRMDGVRAVERIRSGDGLNVSTPIIALTADAMSGDREKYLAKNMNGYVSKPINERELLTEIGRVLSARNNVEISDWSQAV